MLCRVSTSVTALDSQDMTDCRYMSNAHFWRATVVSAFQDISSEVPAGSAASINRWRDISLARNGVPRIPERLLCSGKAV